MQPGSKGQGQNPGQQNNPERREHKSEGGGNPSNPGKDFGSGGTQKKAPEPAKPLPRNFGVSYGRVLAKAVAKPMKVLAAESTARNATWAKPER